MINNNKKRLPWITKEIKALIRKRNKIYQKKKRNKCTRTTKKYHASSGVKTEWYWVFSTSAFCLESLIKSPLFLNGATPVEGEVPKDWRQANVIPVFKKGEKYLASNYRPVSLTCICEIQYDEVSLNTLMKILCQLM
jgi:hypothetical protein